MARNQEERSLNPRREAKESLQRERRVARKLPKVERSHTSDHSDCDDDYFMLLFF